MEKISRVSELEVHDLNELSSTYLALIKKAGEALAGSHSPYSSFPVGAALLLDNGKLIVGSNQENAAYPSGLCAERVALFAAGAQYPKVPVRAIAIALGQPIDHYPTPCGGCLQVISEYQDKQSQPIDVLLLHPTKDQVLYSKGVQNFLPFAFDKSFLGK